MTSEAVADDRRAVLMVEEGGRGGVADYTESLVAALADLGIPVDLVTATDHRHRVPADVRVYPWLPYLRATTPLNRLLRRLHLGRIINGLRFLATMPRIAWLGRHARVVHVQGGQFLPLYIVLAAMLRLEGVRLVHSPHNTFDRGPAERRRTRAAIGRAAARTIVHTRVDLERLPPGTRDRGVVIPHGEYARLADSARAVDRPAARAQLGLEPDAPTTLVFGQLRPDKGIRDVLEAARLLPPLHVLLAGDELGGLAGAADLLDAPDLRDRVIVRRGFQEMDDAAVLFAATDTVTLAYPEASASGVLFLAYAFARPVVVYPVAALLEAVVDGETGWVSGRSDPRALADALGAAAAAGPEECARRGAAGLRLAGERYSWAEIARRTSELYAEVSGISPAT